MEEIDKIKKFLIIDEFPYARSIINNNNYDIIK